MTQMFRSTARDGTVSRTAGSLALACLSAVILVLALGAGTAGAATGLTNWETETSSTQAGGHPNIRFSVSWLNRNDEPHNPCLCDDAKTVEFHFPTGFIGDPHSQAQCTLTQFNLAQCPMESQIGLFSTGIQGKGTSFETQFFVPIYNMEVHPNQAGQLGFTLPLIVFPVFVDLRSRTNSDYGLDSVTFPIVHLLAINTIETFLWGVPSNPEHDFFRFRAPLEGTGECGYPLAFLSKCGGGEVTGFSSGAPERPYLENPTTCGIPLNFSVDIQYYSGEHYHADDPFPPTTGCNQLTFNPSISVTPTTDQADTATGVDVDLKVPQAPSPTTPSPSEIKTTRTTLPPGFTINPSAADGKVVCTKEETAIGTLGAAHCPEAAKVGTLSLDIAALPEPIPGAIYLGEPLPGEKYRLVIAADGFATHVKLTGTIKADPQTGQLTIEFADLPQSPMQRFNMHFFGSERGMLATPTECGTYPVQSEFVPWDEALPVQASTSFFTIGSGPNGAPCPPKPRPFNPGFEGGTEDPTAGRFTPLSLRVDRPDGDQNLTGLQVSAPRGVLASLKGIPYCPQSAIDLAANPTYTGMAELAGSACPAASQVGTAIAGSGAGTHAVYTPGKVFLAGPYKGAPLSLETVVPAVSGPYDLGNVALRVALYVDPTTAQVTAVSDPFPQILEGIPLRLRSVQVSLSRPGFSLNPTNCQDKSLVATLLGSEGASVQREAQFQVANCAELGFEPKLSLRLKGSKKRSGNPSLRAVLTMPDRDANVASSVIALPHSELLDITHIKTLCTRVQFGQGSCPADSVYGEAEATTPLLEQPLRGPVYLRSSSHRLPDLVAALHGQIDVDLVGRIDSIKGGMRASFESLPDAPLTRFVLRMDGGDKGLLENDEDLCHAKYRKANVKMVGQNGVRKNGKVKLGGTSCGSKKKHARRARHSRWGR